MFSHLGCFSVSGIVWWKRVSVGGNGETIGFNSDLSGMFKEWGEGDVDIDFVESNHFPPLYREEK